MHLVYTWIFSKKSSFLCNFATTGHIAALVRQLLDERTITLDDIDPRPTDMDF